MIHMSATTNVVANDTHINNNICRHWWYTHLATTFVVADDTHQQRHLHTNDDKCRRWCESSVVASNTHI